jgi:hypothetical protein
MTCKYCGERHLIMKKLKGGRILMVCKRCLRPSVVNIKEAK